MKAGEETLVADAVSAMFQRIRDGGGKEVEKGTARAQLLPHEQADRSTLDNVPWEPDQDGDYTVYPPLDKV